MRWQVGRWSRNSLIITLALMAIAMIPTLYSNPYSAELWMILVAIFAAIALVKFSFQEQSWDEKLGSVVATSLPAMVYWIWMFLIERDIFSVILVISGIMFILAFFAHVAITKMIRG